jgi:hypothetical protein
MAGLLTFLISGGLPIPIEMEQWQGMPETQLRLQQRVLSRIFTWFPIIRIREYLSGTTIITNIGKTSTKPGMFLSTCLIWHKFVFLDH